MAKIIGKRVVFSELGRVDIEDFQVREPKKRDVVVRTISSLISPGTEGAFLMGLPNTPKIFPQYPGGANAGEVIAVGPKVTGVHVGDRVITKTPHASHTVIAEEDVWNIPDNLSLDEATFVSLACTALHGIRKARIDLGDSVLVMGQGLVGQLTLQLAKVSGGTPLIAVDLYNNRLKIASEMGAEWILNPRNTILEEEVNRITDGKGMQIVIETTGNSEAVPLSFELAGRLGTVVLLGSSRGESNVNFYSLVHRKGITVIGVHDFIRPEFESFHGSWTLRDAGKLILRLLSRRVLVVADLVSMKLSFKESQRAYRTAVENKQEVLGIILDWTK